MRSRLAHTSLSAARLVLAGALIVSPLAALLVPSVTYADDVADEADLQFNLGADAYEKADFKVALEHFLASNRLVPNKNVVFNIARTYEQLKQGADAYRYYVLALEGETNEAARKRVQEALARIAPTVAVVRVTTDPPGATIYVDRKDLGGRGNTPRALALPPGPHKIIVELPGYEPQTADADLRIGAEAAVEMKLAQIYGTVHVDGQPQGAQVHIDREDGPPVGIVPCDVLVPPGRHTLVLTKDGYLTYVAPVDVPPKSTITAFAKLQAQTGAVVVEADVRDALITVDDKPSGFTPAVLNVPVGQHKVRVAASGFRPVEREVAVKANEQAKLDIRLTGLQEVQAASRQTESVEDAPASVTIISREELRAMQYWTIAEAVRGVRGLYLSDDRSYTTIGVRGFSRPGDYGNRILVMIDGQPTNDNYIWSSYVGFDGRVDLDDIDRIEVIRGPGSVVYGTGAFFGVINLVTRPRTQPTHAEVGVSTVEYGVGRARVSGVWRAMPDGSAGAWTSVSVAQGTGRDFYFGEFRSDPRDPAATTDATGLPADGNARGVDGFTAMTVGGRAWWNALTMQWFLTAREKQLPTGEYQSVFSDPRTRFDDTRGFLEARFEPQITEQVQSLTRAHANFYNFDGHTTYNDLPDGSSQDTFRGQWAGLEQRFVITPVKPLKLTVGGEVIRDFRAEQRGISELSGTSYIFDNNGNPVEKRNDPFTVAAGYAIADLTPVERLKISAGARFDYYSNLEKIDALSQFNPRLAFIVKPYNGGNIKLMGGKAFRAPSVYELYYQSQTQTRAADLQPEQVYSGELEYTHHFSDLVSGTAAYYANYVKNLVELNNLDPADTTCVTPPCQQYQNSADPVLVLGMEYEIRREWRQGWMLGATYSFAKARYLNDPTRGKVPNSPLHLASVKAAVPIIGRTLMGMTRISLEGPRPDRNEFPDPTTGTTNQRWTDAGVIWDLVLSGEIEQMGVHYAIGAYNVADWRYDTVPSGEFTQRTIVQNGRTFLASVSVSF